MANTLKVTLVKSPIGAVEMPDNAATRGMIQQVQHLVKVEEA